MALKRSAGPAGTKLQQVKDALSSHWGRSFVYLQTGQSDQHAHSAACCLLPSATEEDGRLGGGRKSQKVRVETSFSGGGVAVPSGGGVAVSAAWLFLLKGRGCFFWRGRGRSF